MGGTSGFIVVRLRTDDSSTSERVAVKEVRDLQRPGVWGWGVCGDREIVEGKLKTTQVSGVALWKVDIITRNLKRRRGYRREL